MKRTLLINLIPLIPAAVLLIAGTACMVSFFQTAGLVNNPTPYTILVTGRIFSEEHAIPLLSGSAVYLPPGDYRTTVESSSFRAREGCGAWKIETTYYGQSLSNDQKFTMHPGSRIVLRCLRVSGPK